MKKKFFVVLFAIIAALGLCFGLAACGEDGGTQTEPGGTSQEYTITYDANGGAFTSGETFTQTVRGNSTLTAPTSPTRQYYTFAGWAKSRGGSELWDFSNDKVTGNTTLYAVWTQKSAVILSVEGASIEGNEVFLFVEPETAEVNLTGGKVMCSEDSTWHLYRKGSESEIYTKTASLVDGNNEFSIVVTSKDGETVNTYDLTVHRKYTTHVTYMTNGAVYDTKDIVTGTPLTQNYNIACSVKGYTFNGWKHDLEFGKIVLTSLIFTADLTANTYKLRYDANGGEGEIQEQEVKMDTMAEVSSGAKFKRNYFILSSFNTQADGGGETIALGSSMEFDFAENTTLYAIWDCDYDYTSSSDGITITGCKRLYSKVDFTDEFDGKPIVAIASQAFKDNTTLRQIIIPDSVKSIGAGTFSGCSGLTSMTIPFVGESAKKATDTYQYPFGYIFGTTSYTGGTAVMQYYYGSSTSEATHGTFYIPDTLKSVTVTGGDILHGAFAGCRGLESVTTGEGVTSIGEVAFQYCSGLESVTIGNGVASIGRDAFYGCSGLTGELKIPNSVTSIGSQAFCDCSGLTRIVIPDSVTRICSLAFLNCSELTRVDITDLAAWYKIDFDDSYANPLYYAHHLYLDNVEVKDLAIPAGIKEIKSYAFYGCSGLTSIEIPDSVTSIGYQAFEGTAYYNDAKKWDESGVLYIGNHLIEAKNTISGDYTIRSNTKTIAAGAFSGCSGLTGELKIPDSVTSIGRSAFSGCSGLTGELKIPGGVTEIGNYAFHNCSGLTSITIPDGVTSIGSSAFEGCSGLTSVTIGSGVTSIGIGAFSDCSGLKTVYFKGTSSEWDGIQFSPYDDYGAFLKKVTRYYYSDQTPSAEQWTESPNWWHYDENGETIILWTKEE